MKIISLFVLALTLAFGSQAIAAEKKPIDFFEIYNEAKQFETALGGQGIDSEGRACKFSARLDPNNDEGEEGNYALWLMIENEEEQGLRLYILNQMKFDSTESTQADGTVTKKIFHKHENFLNYTTAPGGLKTVQVGVEDPLNCGIRH